jgi:hypothetical protein
MSRDKLGLIIVALLISPITFADQRIQLPNGTGCWQNDVGFVYGCDPAPSSTNEQSSSHTDNRYKLKQMEEWKQCERKKDWVGQRSNCDSLYPN